MSDTFTVYIRNGERVLLMQRADGVADFPGAWDGIYGIGDPENLDTVVARITEVTGIEADNLQYVRSGGARGLAYENRLNEVTPLLFISSVEEVDARGLYKGYEWIDPGTIQEREYSTPQLRDMYGDVASYLYILKTSIGQEQNVANEVRARLSGTGSLEDIQDEIFGVLSPHFMRGYIFVEASALHHVEKLIGRVGVSTTPMKNCRKVLGGESPLGDVLPYLEPKAATAGIEEGSIVEIHGGAFRGQAARVTRVTESKEEVTVELFEAAVPVALTVRADQVRVTQRVE
ncbi:MAG: transcription elongation factor Spt5 [Candidatus Poseidoniales archaeon]|jgi:transcriptional antiterminator NusG|nr:transcription elongation factor Spt5 [Candidatus Poseidoniales archaeon]|tara:strand:- start:2911 stop:3777 length:867 start_codon:yes stop_codon:yes gene_type:complete